MSTAAQVVGSIRGVRATLGFLGGLWSAWSTAYNGTQYYASWPNAARQLGAIAKLIRAGNEKAAHAALDLWLNAFDPLGVVRDAIARDTIVDDDTLFREVPPR